MVVRMSFGCGSVQPAGWVHVDKDFRGDVMWWDKSNAGLPINGPWKIDVRRAFPRCWEGSFDYIVANHSLSDLTHHELSPALNELYRVLKPGGVLRVMVPDLMGAVEAYRRGDAGWFPQGDDLDVLAERFCTFVTWFGTVGSVFTPSYLWKLLRRAGFDETMTTIRGRTMFGPPGILELDDDRTTALVMEGRKK